MKNLKQLRTYGNPEDADYEGALPGGTYLLKLGSCDAISLIITNKVFIGVLVSKMNIRVGGYTYPDKLSLP